MDRGGARVHRVHGGPQPENGRAHGAGGGPWRRRHGRRRRARRGGATGQGGVQRGHGRVARAEASAVRVLDARGRGRGGRAARRAARRRRSGEVAHVTERENEREGHRRIPHLNAKLGGRSSLPEMQRKRRFDGGRRFKSAAMAAALGS